MAQFVRVALLLLAAFVAGCATSSPTRVPTRDLIVDSVPNGADAVLPSGTRCKTPCKVRVNAQAIVEIKFTKTGCLTQSQLVVPAIDALRPDWVAYSRNDRPLVANLICDDDQPVASSRVTASAGP